MIDPLPDQSLVHKSAAFAWLRSAWDWLGQSYASGVEKDRVKSRLMSYLLIFMVLFLSLVFPILLYFDPLLPAGPMSIGFGVTIAVFCAAYAISRTKYAFLAASMTVLISAVSAWMLTYARAARNL